MTGATVATRPAQRNRDASSPGTTEPGRAGSVVYDPRGTDPAAGLTRPPVWPAGGLEGSAGRTDVLVADRRVVAAWRAWIARIGGLPPREERHLVVSRDLDHGSMARHLFGRLAGSAMTARVGGGGSDPTRCRAGKSEICSLDPLDRDRHWTEDFDSWPRDSARRVEISSTPLAKRWRSRWSVQRPSRLSRTIPPVTSSSRVSPSLSRGSSFRPMRCRSPMAP